MRLGISTFTFPRSIAAGVMDGRGLVQWAVDHHAEAVQFADNLEIFEVPDFREVIRLAQGNGISIELGTRGIDHDHLAKLFDLSQEIGGEFVRIVIDRGSDEPSPEEAIDRLGPFVGRAPGVALAIENHDRFPARVLRQMVATLDCRVCLDTANSLGSLEGTETAIAELGHLAINLHVKDVRASRKPANLGFDIVGTAAGEGQVDWRWVISQVPNAISATVELWTPDGPDAPSIEEVWARRSVANLRGLLAPSPEPS